MLKNTFYFKNMKFHILLEIFLHLFNNLSYQAYLSDLSMIGFCVIYSFMIVIILFIYLFSFFLQEKRIVRITEVS